MKYIAIIGYGIVGGGITEVLRENSGKIRSLLGDGIEVRYILDLRDFPGSPYADRVVHSLDPILADPEVEAVCETMGGSHPALEYSLRCMEAGKSVVTSNKEVVARYGDVLLEAAKTNGVDYLFEASVGGGIPVIRPFLTSLAGETVRSVGGIVNGTTNYILTRMGEEGIDFPAALAEAQALGYAERDPSADVDGLDGQRKIIILTALATDLLLPEEAVTTETLRSVTPADLAGAAKAGGSVRYLALAETEGAPTAFVCPMIVRNDHPFSGITGVYNGIAVRFSLTGDILYYGRGAGRYPTAGAVVSDLFAVLSGAAGHEMKPRFTKAEPGAVRSLYDKKFAWYVRAEADGAALARRLEEITGRGELIGAGNGAAEVLTGEVTKSLLEETLSGLKVASVLRILA